MNQKNTILIVDDDPVNVKLLASKFPQNQYDTILAYDGIYGSFFFGILALESGLYKQVHRADRCDLTLFQLGFWLLNYLAVRGLPIPLPKVQKTND